MSQKIFSMRMCSCYTTDCGGPSATCMPNGSLTPGESGSTVVPPATVAAESTDGPDVNDSQGE